VLARNAAAALLVALGLAACGTPFYEVCDAEGRCPSGYLCADAETLPICTTLCTATDECAQHGDRAFCSRAGVCMIRCSSDRDCPSTAYCDVASSTCLR
jgi:hypothetical protein